MIKSFNDCYRHCFTSSYKCHIWMAPLMSLFHQMSPLMENIGCVVSTYWKDKWKESLSYKTRSVPYISEYKWRPLIYLMVASFLFLFLSLHKSDTHLLFVAFSRLWSITLSVLHHLGLTNGMPRSFNEMQQVGGNPFFADAIIRKHQYKKGKNVSRVSAIVHTYFNSMELFSMRRASRFLMDLGCARTCP